MPILTELLGVPGMVLLTLYWAVWGGLSLERKWLACQRERVALDRERLAKRREERADRHERRRPGGDE